MTTPVRIDRFVDTYMTQEPVREDRRIIGESICCCGAVWPGEIGKTFGCPDCVVPPAQFRLVEQSQQPYYDWFVAARVAFGVSKLRNRGAGVPRQLYDVAVAYNDWLVARVAVKLSEGAIRKRVVWTLPDGTERRALSALEARRLIRHHEHRATRDRFYAVLRCLHGIEEWTSASRDDAEVLLATAAERQLRIDAVRRTP